MSIPTAESNLRVYESDRVATHYAALDYLTHCERLLLASYLKPGSSILDLGVGGGRTTRYLTSVASDYVGVDYSESMVRACREKFPSLDFIVADAGNLSQFPDARFDAIVIAFNGIDYILPDESRHSCLRHLYRMLKPKGYLIFSSHNPRALVVRQGWNRERLLQIAQRFSGGRRLLGKVLWFLLTIGRVALAIGQATWKTVMRISTIVPSRVFWRGEGTAVDSSHGGLLTHCWIPQRTISELNEHGFRVERVVGNDYPHPSHECATDWYYYVFTKY